MTFDEWLESYFSGTQIDDVVTGMMRTAFEAGREYDGQVWDKDIASDAYTAADAMLKERLYHY